MMRQIAGSPSTKRPAWSPSFGPLASASARDSLVRYDFGSIPIEILFGTLNTKDQAAQSRITALTGLWTEFYRLRRVTMFDFETARAIR